MVPEGISGQGVALTRMKHLDEVLSGMRPNPDTVGEFRRSR
jgi:hypothetical protein